MHVSVACASIFTLICTGCGPSDVPAPRPSGGDTYRVHEDLNGTYSFSLDLGGRETLLGMRNGQQLDYAIVFPESMNIRIEPDDKFDRDIEGMGALPVLWPRDGSRVLFFNGRRIAIPQDGKLFVLDYDGSVIPVPVDGLDLSPIEAKMIFRSHIQPDLEFSPVLERIYDILGPIQQRQNQKGTQIIRSQRESAK